MFVSASVSPRRDSPSVLVVGHVLQPIHHLAVQSSWMAMCVIAVVGEAPCQCFSPGGNMTTSPGRISSTGPPQRCTRPTPAVTISVCPSGVGVPGGAGARLKVTLAPVPRAGSDAWKSGSIRTVPVK